MRFKCMRLALPSAKRVRKKRTRNRISSGISRRQQLPQSRTWPQADAEDSSITIDGSSHQTSPIPLPHAIGPLIVAQEVSSATPQFRYLNVRHFLATFGGFCPTFLPTFWPFGPQICPKSAFDVQKIDFRPHFFVIFASGSVYGLEMALPRRGLELAVTLIFVDA